MTSGSVLAVLVGLCLLAPGILRLLALVFWPAHRRAKAASWRAQEIRRVERRHMRPTDPMKLQQRAVAQQMLAAVQRQRARRIRGY